jgi:hypothetical protein
VGPSIPVLACDWPVFHALDSNMCFSSISAQISAQHYFPGDMWNLLDNGPMLMLSHRFYMYYAGIDALKMVRNKRQQLLQTQSRGWPTHKKQ